jgi:hypothetical protein
MDQYLGWCSFTEAHSAMATSGKCDTFRLNLPVDVVLDRDQPPCLGHPRAANVAIMWLYDWTMALESSLHQAWDVFADVFCRLLVAQSLSSAAW